MKNILKTLEPNLLGRDFVIGDLHGSMSVFKNLLRNINFNPEVDRIISVGDLIDRGPDSLGCLALIREPWFHAVLSNHEQMMMHKFANNPRGMLWWYNGGGWGMEAWNDYQSVYVKQDKSKIPVDTSMELIDLLPLVEELPFLITVKTKAGKKFHIIHAELPPHPILTDTDLENPEKITECVNIETRDGPSLMWGRYIFDPFGDEDLNDQNRGRIVRIAKNKAKNITNRGLSHIISGHTILHRPLTICNRTNIDTGAFDSYWKTAMPYEMKQCKPVPWAALTCIELDTWKFYQATTDKFSEVEPMVVTESDING